MPLELNENARGSAGNACFLATACDLAYLPQAQGADEFRKTLSLEARLISVGNTQVYIGTNDKHLVAAFRGSESPTSVDGLRDWLLTNAVNFLIVPEGLIGTDFAAAGVRAKFHQGFMKALADIWGPFFDAVQTEQDKSERQLWVTGHSLGGALALLASWRLHRNAMQIQQLYTFGAPMVGNGEAVKAFDREFAGKIYRYVNYHDIVPKLPTVSLLANEYGHCEKEMCVGVLEEGSHQFLSQLAGSAVDGILTGTIKDSIWAYLNDKLSAHDIVGYRKLVESA